jgi:hypothetical protein
MINIIFLICWILIILYVILADLNKKTLKFYAVLGGLMGILFYAEKIF